jgi:phage terminase large subunit-like protein
MPGRHAEFKIKRLNRPAAGATAWVNLQKWARCNGAVDLEWLRGKPCVMTLDLASTTDLAVVRLTWRADGMYYTWGRRYVPESAVKQRTERGTVPYAAWVQAGLIVQTEGDVTDYAVIEKDIVDLADRFTPTEIAFDPWNATDLVNRLSERGLPMVEFIQGTKSYHPAMQELERAYIAGKLRHGGDPVLTWCASNIVARTDPNLNTAPDRKRSAEKIDDMCALLMGVGRLIAADDDTNTMPDDYQLLSV